MNKQTFYEPCTFSEGKIFAETEDGVLPLRPITLPSYSVEEVKPKLKMVVGFMFNEKETDVLLIIKQKPAWQKNKFNGIGGKVEPGETFLQAMVREFHEETGLEQEEWHEVIMMYGDDWEVQVFTAKSDDVFYGKTMEAEQVCLIPIADLDKYAHVSNLQWLIPMCLDKNNGQGKINYCLSLNPQKP